MPDEIPQISTISMVNQVEKNRNTPSDRLIFDFFAPIHDQVQHAEPNAYFSNSGTVRQGLDTLLSLSRSAPDLDKTKAESERILGVMRLQVKDHPGKDNMLLFIAEIQNQSIQLDKFPAIEFFTSTLPNAEPVLIGAFIRPLTESGIVYTVTPQGIYTFTSSGDQSIPHLLELDSSDHRTLDDIVRIIKNKEPIVRTRPFATPDTAVAVSDYIATMTNPSSSQ